MAAFVSDDDRCEGLSFAVLHTFYPTDWTGQNVRNAVAVLSALGIMLYGLALLLKTRC